MLVSAISVLQLSGLETTFAPLVVIRRKLQLQDSLLAVSEHNRGIANSAD